MDQYIYLYISGKWIKTVQNFVTCFCNSWDETTWIGVGGKYYLFDCNSRDFTAMNTKRGHTALLEFEDLCCTVMHYGKQCTNEILQ